MSVQNVYNWVGGGVYSSTNGAVVDPVSGQVDAAATGAGSFTVLYDLLETRDDAAEKRDVAIDEIEPRFVRLPPQTGGDADDVGVRAVGVIARADDLVAAKRRAVQKVERLAFRRRLVGVEDEDFADDAAALQRERRTRTDAATAADDSYFHVRLFREVGDDFVGEFLHERLEIGVTAGCVVGHWGKCFFIFFIL